MNVLYSGRKILGGKDREGSFQVKQRPTGFIGSADDIIFSNEPGFSDNSHVLVEVTVGMFWVLSGLLGGKV